MLIAVISHGFEGSIMTRDGVVSAVRLLTDHALAMTDDGNHNTQMQI